MLYDSCNSTLIVIKSVSIPYTSKLPKELKMTNIFCICLILVSIACANGSTENFDEKSWLDNSRREQFFENSETEPAFDAVYDLNGYNYSNNIDSTEMHQKSVIRVKTKNVIQAKITISYCFYLIEESCSTAKCKVKKSSS